MSLDQMADASMEIAPMFGPVLPEDTKDVPGLPNVYNRAFDANTYGSIWIDRTEFALPVDALQEVVKEPDSYAPVPKAPPHMLGVFNLRGTIVPVIDLRILLDLPECSEAKDRHVAIIENGELCVGLLFDNTGGVLHCQGAAKVKFEANPDGVRDTVVQGVLKLDDGNRMVQILDPYEILDIKRVPRVAKVGQAAYLKDKRGDRHSCISFQIGHTTCALDVRVVQEILDVPELLDTPLAHNCLLGNINVRGHTIPVVDFRGVFGREDPDRTVPTSKLHDRKLIVLELPEGPIALLVYSIDNIVSYFECDILPFATLSLPRNDVVSGCLIDNENIIILLDYEQLKQDEELIYAARSCQEIYPPDTRLQIEEKERAQSARRTFAVFSMDTQYALNTDCVSEVINRPGNLLSPPYALDFVEGILNLRGELITLINPRLLYGLPIRDTKAHKILIFHAKDKKFGILVDSIDEIFIASGDEILDVPALSKTDQEKIVTSDVCACLRSRTSPERDPIMIFDADAIIERCALS